MKVLLLDLTTLRLELNNSRGTATLMAATREILTAIPTVEGDTNKQTTMAACFDAMRRTRIRREVGDGPQMVPVALYDPFTAQSMLHLDGRSTVFADGRPMSLPPGGLVVEVDTEQMFAGGRRVPRKPQSSRPLLKALAIFD